MPYTPVNFQDGVTPLNAATMNKLDDALEDLYTNPAAALTYEGDHVPATSYQDGDIVVKDGIAYLCVGGPTTAAPNPVPWGPAGMMSGYIKTTDRGVANGVASLNANGKVPEAQQPPANDACLCSGAVVSTGTGWKALPLGTVGHNYPAGAYTVTADGAAHYITVARTGVYHLCGSLALTPTVAGVYTIVVGSVKDDWQRRVFDDRVRLTPPHPQARFYRRRVQRDRPIECWEQ